MSLGLIAAITGAVALAGWGVVLFRRGRSKERGSEKSSHHESQAGFLGSQDSTPHND
jgi:hypothetical protein